MGDRSVNSQITDALTQINAVLVGNSSPQSLAVMNAVMADTMGMAMHNAVSAQHHAQMIGGASTTSACARMLGTMSPPPAPAPSAPKENKGSKFFDCAACDLPDRDGKESASKLKTWLSGMFREHQAKAGGEGGAEAAGPPLEQGAGSGSEDLSPDPEPESGPTEKKRHKLF